MPELCFPFFNRLSYLPIPFVLLEQIEEAVRMANAIDGVEALVVEGEADHALVSPLKAKESAVLRKQKDSVRPRLSRISYHRIKQIADVSTSFVDALSLGGHFGQ